MSVVKELLLDVWHLPDPNWIISVMGDEHKRKGDDASTESGLPKQKQLETHVEAVISLFSYGQSVWVTTEGINYGVAKVVGEVLCKANKQKRNNTSSVGIFGWGACQEKARECLENENEKSLENNKESNRPSGLYPHHLLVDDGSINHSFAHKSFQEIRTELETSLTNHNDESSSLPLVILLYGGWNYVIDGIVAAVESNVPIVVLKGTGGFADVLAKVYETSTADPVNTSTGEHGRKWTGTVIDDRLRQRVKQRFEVVNGEEFKEGQHKILQCLQKRELITLVDLDVDPEALAKAIIQALLKTMTTPEILRIIDYYMPSRMFEGKGTAAASMAVMRVNEKGLNKVASLFLFQAMELDLAELVQFIIDYEGVELSTFINERENCFSKGDETDSYKILLRCAVRRGHQKCAALFWKKGNDLLASALEMTAVIQTMKGTEENIGKQKHLEEHSVLFQKRAVGLIDECYHDDKNKSLKLIQRQGEDNVWTDHGSLTSTPSRNQVLDRCFDECNRRIFATDAFKSYMGHVLYGRITPPKLGSSNRKMIISQQDLEQEPVGDKIKRILRAPITTYLLNLIFNVIFLALFGHTLLFELDKKYSPLEVILAVWWFTFVVEEIRQFWNEAAPGKKNRRARHRFGAKLKGYFFGNYWNILDCVCLVFFLVGAVLMSVHHVDSTRDDVYQAARMFLSLDIMFFTWRLLQHFAMSSNLGPVLVMIYEMIQDLMPFLAVMLVFIISQGLAAHALLYPNRDWSPQALLYIPKNAFWNLFGELGLEEIEAQEPEDCSSDPRLYKNETKDECPSSLGQYAVPFLLGTHMLLMNVLLLNIVIARFSFTFQKIHEQTTWIAAWQRARVTLEYYKKPTLPPPLNVFFHVGKFIYMHLSKCRVGNEEGKDVATDLPPWERSMAENYLASAEFKSGSERLTLREKKEVIDDSQNPPKQKTSGSAIPSTYQTEKSEPTVNERSSTQTEGFNKRLKKVESSQREIKTMLEEVLKVVRNLSDSSPKVGFMNLEDTREEDV